jgi:hypothetical protein
MATPIILYLNILALVWLVLLRRKMPNHENLQAVGTIVIIWATLFFGVLAIPQYIPNPLNFYLAIVITVGALSFLAVYFGYLKRHKQEPSEKTLNLRTLQATPMPTELFETDGVGAFPIVKYQCLSVKAENYSGSLAATIRIGDEEPFHVGWPTRTVSGSNTILVIHADGTAQIVGTSTLRQFLEGDETRLPVWFAYAIRDRVNVSFGEIMEAAKLNRPVTENYRLLFNTTVAPLRFVKPEEIQRGYLDLTIQFTPSKIDKKPRKYRLNVKSWDELDLTGPLS